MTLEDFLTRFGSSLTGESLIALGVAVLAGVTASAVCPCTLPMGLGIGVRLAVPRAAEWLRPRVARVGMVMLICVALVIVVMIAPAVVQSGFRLALASALITVCALAIGHALGGPDRETRVTVAVGSAARNPGLALLVAQLNPTSPEVGAAVMTHLLVSALTITPYVMRRVRIR